MIEENEMLAAEMEGAIDQMMSPDQDVSRATRTPRRPRRRFVAKRFARSPDCKIGWTRSSTATRRRWTPHLRDALANLQVS